MIYSSSICFGQDEQELTPPPETPSPTQDADSLPKGYDDSFHTGDMPKSNSSGIESDEESADATYPRLNPDLNPNTQDPSDLRSRDFLFGASASLTVPHLMNIGLETIIFRKFGVSLNYGNVTRRINNVDLMMQHMDARFRWFPMGTSFFAGIALGRHQITGELDRDISYTAADSKKLVVQSHGKLTAHANYVAPHIGWFSVWDSGFTMGFDVGYLFPTSPGSKFSSSFKNAPADSDAALRETQDYKRLKEDLEDSAKAYASKGLPFVNILRLGWMF
jgi:hypothetical protein